MEWVYIVTQLVMGWIYGHIVEYAIHRWIFHTIGKKKGHPLSFHVHDHHKTCRRNALFDVAYKKIGTSEEFWGLLFLAVMHVPLAFFLPYFYCAIIFSIMSYYLTRTGLERIYHTTMITTWDQANA